MTGCVAHHCRMHGSGCSMQFSIIDQKLKKRKVNCSYVLFIEVSISLKIEKQVYALTFQLPKR